MKRVFVTLLVAIFATVAFAQNRTDLKPTDLSKKITDYVATTYKDFTIEKAYKLEKEGVITYSVIVIKGTERHKANFDKDGNYLKPPVMVGKPVEKKTEKAPEPKKDEPKPKTAAAPSPAPTVTPVKK